MDMVQCGAHAWLGEAVGDVVLRPHKPDVEISPRLYASRAAATSISKRFSEVCEALVMTSNICLESVSVTSGICCREMRSRSCLMTKPSSKASAKASISPAMIDPTTRRDFLLVYDSTWHWLSAQGE